MGALFVLGAAVVFFLHAFGVRWEEADLVTLALGLWALGYAVASWGGVIIPVARTRGKRE